MSHNLEMSISLHQLQKEHKMYIIKLVKLSLAGKLQKSILQVVCQVPVRMRCRLQLLLSQSLVQWLMTKKQTRI